MPPDEALSLAQGLLDSGRPFHAHEVLEASWKAAPAAERELWKGLAQIAVGLTHARRGNATGAAALLRRGGQRVGGYAGAAPYGIDAGTIARQASSLADRIDADGLAAAAGDGASLPPDLKRASGPGGHRAGQLGGQPAALRSPAWRGGARRDRRVTAAALGRDLGGRGPAGARQVSRSPGWRPGGGGPALALTSEATSPAVSA